MSTNGELEKIYRHISHVHHNCKLLADRLRERNAPGDSALAWELMAAGMKHDASKFTGIERLYLNEDTKQKEPEKFAMALDQHQRTNPHHPEHWENGIADMPNVYLAEMVCDWYARSIEFGTDLREWILETAFPRYGVSKSSKKGKQIMIYLALLLDRPFK